jgi:carbon-monoxide dehydrogenase medium subunit
VGHLAIRVRGTVAGSIAHADPASELPALLLCFDGSVVAQSPRGERTVGAVDFFQGPLATALAGDEIATETRWTLPAPGTGWGFHEVARRHGDFALAGVAAQLRLAAGRVSEARVALFGVGPTALRSRPAEQRLIGGAATAAEVGDAAAAGAAELRPDGDLHASADYRRRVARTLIARAVGDAVARARKDSS